MIESVIFFGFGVWQAFVFSDQIRFMYLLDKAWKKKQAMGEHSGRRFYIPIRFSVSVINLLGALALASIYGSYQPVHDSFAALGVVVGVVCFLICNHLLRKFKFRD